MHINILENTEVIKPPEKVDDFLLSLFKALDRQKSKDERKTVEKKVIINNMFHNKCQLVIILNVTSIYK